MFWSWFKIGLGAALGLGAGVFLLSFLMSLFSALVGG